MQYLNVVLTSLCSIVALFLLTKLMGNKQLSQLSLFDYIVGISIGSIAAELATELEEPLLPLIAMAVYALCALAISALTSSSIKLRRVLAGRPVLLLDNGQLYRKNFRKARLDVNDFTAMARVNGFYRISDIAAAMLEINGQISLLPKSDARPLTPSDMGLQPKQEHMEVTLIADGKLMRGNLRLSGMDEATLNDKLQQMGYDSPKPLFLCLTDEEGKLTVFEK